MTETADLLKIRLDALELDIAKVGQCVDVAKKRGLLLEDAMDALRPQKRILKALSGRLNDLADAMAEEPELRESLADAVMGLDQELLKAPKMIASVIDAVGDTENRLTKVMATTVTLEDENLTRLQSSLNQRCDKVRDKVVALRRKVEVTGADERRLQWLEYQQLLEDQARPVFMEYVDFLGGLTVRDTGLDDQVCEMTDALLTRFTGATNKSLPLPARQAALGSALDSIVLLGFPEWSIWGIPLVAHEVGLAYAKDRNNPALAELIDRFVLKRTAPDQTAGTPGTPGRTKNYVKELLADAFAAYTLGMSYACAALLLRLSPRHDEPYDPETPHDIERARVIMLTMLIGGDTAPQAGGSFTDDVSRLEETWRKAVSAHAGPAAAAEAVQESIGPPPETDWVDDFTEAAVSHFRQMTMIIRPYDDERWRASELWLEALREQTVPPGWNPASDAVPDVLTAVWRLRLTQTNDPDELASQVKQLWVETGRGG